MSRLLADALKRAETILEENWTGSHTKPSPSLYPHQWNWDSGFIAIGLAHSNPKRAITELETLFEAQWQNGMLPQIVFDPENLGNYFPEPDFWQTERSPHAPTGRQTSGITMPPIHAVAVEKIMHLHGNSRRAKAFLRSIYPKLLKLHTYLHTERDPAGEGLVYIRHPWESGIDNSPTWDGPLGRIKVDHSALPPYKRRDLDHGIDKSMRPTDEEYDRYVYLVELFRRLNYDEERIRRECPFLVQDPLFNAILCRADQSLAQLAALLGEDDSQPLKWAEATSRAIREKLWHEDDAIFDAFDLSADELIHVDSAAGFVPLFSGSPSRGQAERIFERLDSASFCSLHQGGCFTVPNYDKQKPGFERSNYWRGPVWININWMLAEGLSRYGFTSKADSLRKDLLQLPMRFGFFEYFDSVEGHGYGTDNFSWSAALFIDLVNEFYSTESTLRTLSANRAKFSSAMVLNRDAPPSNCTQKELAGELMKAIRKLRDDFYDVKRARIDYKNLKDSPQFAHYRQLAAGLRHFDPATLMGRREKLAFWINLYNTIVIDGIVTLGVQESVREFSDFFTAISYDIGGRLFCPDDIEHGILRGNARPFGKMMRRIGRHSKALEWILTPTDARLHFALVCGSRSCAPIDHYSANEIETQLDEAAKHFVNSSEVIMLPEQNKLLLSELFHWYEDDFGGRTGITDFLYDHLADEELKTYLKLKGRSVLVEYLPYDWNLNN
jgi:hypothetical protein